MASLYPPIVDSRTPSFWGGYLQVYFEHNRSVDPVHEVTGMSLKMRSILNEYDPLGGAMISGDGNWGNPSGPYQVRFNLSSYIRNLNVGQFYKIQIAYLDENNNPGYYSTVSMVKYSTQPTLNITKGDTDTPLDNNPQFHVYEYMGRYSQAPSNSTEIRDYTEKVYSYRFILKYGYSNILADTGWLIHDSSSDENEYSSYDKFNYYSILPDEEECELIYYIKTNTGVGLSTSGKIVNNISIDNDRHCLASLDQDNGYTLITFDGTALAAGQTYNLVRYTQYFNGEEYEWKNAIFLKKITSIEDTFKDFTIEQGLKYLYCLTYVDSELETIVQTDEEEAAMVRADFEDIFLFEGDPLRQLKVRFNGGVNQIHETLQEAKVDTLGGKYPYFFRNGEKRYRDFNISGIISFQGDEQNLFSDLYGVPNQPARERTQTTAAQDPNNQLLNELIEQGYTSSYSDYTLGNYYRERKFREEAYAWLTNGQPKLFRSASEGNVLVRLLNVSMTPFNGTSRMVYQFSCQAYECDGTDYDSLIKNKILIKGV